MEGSWALSRYTGLFTEIGPVPPRPHDPDLVVWGGLLAPWGRRLAALGVGGSGPDRGTAFGACLGEAIERWQPYALPVDQTIFASFNAWPLAEPAVPPESWVIFSPEQHAQPRFPFRPLSGDTVCRWVCCRRADDGSPWWVPEELVYLYARDRDGHAFGPGISTGLSCGMLGQPVLLRGIQEVIERDAVLGAWWGRYPLLECAEHAVLATLDRSLPRRILRPNLRYRFYRVDSPYSAHVTIVTLDGVDREGACFSVGSACRETQESSWLKSITEAVQGRHYVRLLKAERLARGADVADPSTPASFADHAVYYTLHPGALAATVLSRPAGRGADLGASATEDLAVLIERLGPGHPVLFRNLSPPAVAQGPDAWYVLKVLVPGLQPLHGDHRLPFLGGPLWGSRGLTEWSFMPPHPFP